MLSTGTGSFLHFNVQNYENVPQKNAWLVRPKIRHELGPWVLEPTKIKNNKKKQIIIDLPLNAALLS